MVDDNYDFVPLVKEYLNMIQARFINMLSNWKATNFEFKLKVFVPFLNSMYELFPNLNSLDELQRELHIEPILVNMKCSKKQKQKSLANMKTMFDFMCYNKWVKSKIIGVFELGDGCCEHPIIALEIRVLNRRIPFLLSERKAKVNIHIDFFA